MSCKGVYVYPDFDGLAVVAAETLLVNISDIRIRFIDFILLILI